MDAVGRANPTFRKQARLKDAEGGNQETFIALQ